MTVTSIACWAVALGAAREVDTWLAAIASSAMERAGLTQDYVARVTRIPAARLSDQLAGKLPFTGLVRFGCQEIRRDTEFWVAFAEVLAEQIDRAVVPRDLGALVAGVGELIGQKRRMARMSAAAPTQAQEAKAV